MGLGYIAYTDLDLDSPVPIDELNDEELDDYNKFLWISHDPIQEEYWEGRLGGLVPGYAYRSIGNIVSGHIAGYIGFSRWREQLEDFAYYMEDDDLFYELIDFSDCDGIFGPEVCDKLNRDFADMKPDYTDWINDRYASDEISESDRDTGIRIYEELAHAFSMADGGEGAVCWC